MLLPLIAKFSWWWEGEECVDLDVDDLQWEGKM